MSNMPALCTGCDRPLRDARTPAAKRPGAVAYAGKGMCVTCRKRILAGPAPTECDCCGHPLRSRRAPESEHPGTVIHVARGLCRVCYDEQRNLAKTGQMYPDVTPEQHAHTMAGYEAWLKERQKRGVPADGYQLADAPDTVTQLLAPRGKTPSQRRAIARLVEQLEAERAAITTDARAQRARDRNQYGIVA